MERHQMFHRQPAVTESADARGVAERLNVDDRTVRRLFLNEPGVLVICFPRKGRRLYRTLRIPLDVFERVLTHLTNVA